MLRWWKRFNAYRELVNSEAAELQQRHGVGAYALARAAGRLARDKGDTRMARHYI